MAKKPNIQGNKYAHLSAPQAIFDFHGKGILGKEEIRVLAAAFIRKSFQQGMKKVLIITGKGMHSKGGPVVGPLLMEYLPTLPEVHSMVLARRDRGGEGALEVRLVDSF